MRYSQKRFAKSADGTRLFYGVSGHGPCVVLLDGIGCDGFAWRYLMPMLAKQYTVVHCHYRGHGRSGSPRSAQVDVAALAGDVEAVLADLDVTRLALVGHSMGTQVALEVAHRAVFAVVGLVLICGSFGKITEHFHNTDVLNQVLPNLIELVRRRRALVRAIWGRVPASVAFRIARLSREIDGFSLREEDFRRYWDHVGMMDPDLFLEMLQAAGEHSAEPWLGQIAIPTLVIAAERDTFLPPVLAERMAAEIPHAEHCVLKGASHAAPVEQPVAMMERMGPFLESAFR